ncbi:MAG: diiron oxygenase [Frankiales bacterium]|nr:diiron oxygenase [Frankiales bacterium]
MAGFGLMLTTWRDVTDPRITYLLHEVGEETRHSRLFVRMVGQLQPKARNPFNRGINRKVGAWLYRVTASNPLLLFTMVLAGEEIPDLLQKRAVEHPDTDDYLRRVNRYHREEEARHLAFGRMVLPELWSRRPRHERWLVRRVAPHLTRLMVETQLTHPGIYAEAGLPMHRTARAVARSQHHKDFLAEAMRPVLKTVLGAAPELIGKVPRGWRRLCQVDKQGNLLPLATAAA